MQREHGPPSQAQKATRLSLIKLMREHAYFPWPVKESLRREPEELALIHGRLPWKMLRVRCVRRKVRGNIVEAILVQAYLPIFVRREIMATLARFRKLLKNRKFHRGPTCPVWWTSRPWQKESTIRQSRLWEDYISPESLEEFKALFYYPPPDAEGPSEPDPRQYTGTGVRSGHMRRRRAA
jgi:hypothetical protein